MLALGIGIAIGGAAFASWLLRRARRRRHDETHVDPSRFPAAPEDLAARIRRASR